MGNIAERIDCPDGVEWDGNSSRLIRFVNEFLVDIGIYDGGLPPSLSTSDTLKVCIRTGELDKQLFHIETAGLTMCTCLSGRHIVFYLEADGEDDQQKETSHVRRDRDQCDADETQAAIGDRVGSNRGENAERNTYQDRKQQ